MQNLKEIRQEMQLLERRQECEPKYDLWPYTKNGLVTKGCVASTGTRTFGKSPPPPPPPHPVVPKGCVGRVMSRRVEWNAYIREILIIFG